MKNFKANFTVICIALFFILGLSSIESNIIFGLVMFGISFAIGYLFKNTINSKKYNENDDVKF